MLDTIRIGFNYEMSPQELKGWRSKHGEHENGYVTHEYAYSVKAPNNCKITCKYIHTSFAGNPVLTLEFSLPKLLKGNNIPSVSDLKVAISSANEIIAGLPGFPVIDIGRGEILRLDIVYNHYVGDLVSGYIDYLSKQTHSRRTTHSFLYSTVYFSNKSVTTKFYDKYKQCGLDAARGLLRQEISYRNKKRIREIFDAPQFGGLGFTPIKKELEKDLAVLGLDKLIPDDGRYAWKQLVEEHGYYGGTFHYGLLGLAKIYPIPEIAQHGGRHHRSINRLVQNALKTSNGNTAVPLKGYLSALSIDVDIISEKRIVMKDNANV